MTPEAMPDEVWHDDAPADDEIGRKVSRGLGWSLLGQAISRLAVFASGVLLARLLVPEDMGEVAAALFVVNIAMGVNELGVIPALVRWKGDYRHASSTALTLAASASFLIYGIVFMTAPWISTVTGTPGSTSVIRLMGLVVIVDGLIAVPLAILYRGIRTIPQVIAEVLGMLGYVLVSVALAAAGTDAMSIAWGRVVGAVITGAVIVSVARWPAPPGFDYLTARKLLKFGFPLALSTAVFEAVMAIDYLIVGNQLAGAALGAYLLAFNLSSWPVSIVSVAVGRVSFAGYASIVGDRRRFVDGVVHSFAVALSCTVPLVLVIAFLAPEFVGALYGVVWADAAGPLRWLVVVGGLRVLLQLAGEVIAVDGRPAMVLKLRLLWLVVLPLPLFLGAREIGLAGVGMAHVVVALLVMSPLFVGQLTKSGISMPLLLPILVRPLLSGGAMVLTMLLLSRFIDGDLLRLLAVGGMGLVVYSAVLLPSNPTVKRLVGQLRGPGTQEAASTP